MRPVERDGPHILVVVNQQLRRCIRHSVLRSLLGDAFRS
jgi:hypothetical protein